MCVCTCVEATCQCFCKRTRPLKFPRRGSIIIFQHMMRWQALFWSQRVTKGKKGRISGLFASSFAAKPLPRPYTAGAALTCAPRPHTFSPTRRIVWRGCGPTFTMSAGNTKFLHLIRPFMVFIPETSSPERKVRSRIRAAAVCVCPAAAGRVCRVLLMLHSKPAGYRFARDQFCAVSCVGGAKLA